MDKLASDLSVKKHTGKEWSDWIKILNNLGCRNWSHKEVVALLKAKFKLTPWWQQVVARGFHVKTGIRSPQQTLKGTYTTTVTKSFNLNPQQLYSFVISPKGQKIWLHPLDPLSFKQKEPFECLGEIFGEVRIVKINKTLRLTWNCEDWPRKTHVQLNIYSKGKNKSMLVLNHTDLPSLKAKKQMHTHWRKAIDDLFTIFNSIQNSS